MDPLRAKFIEEAEDLVLDLEKSVLALEKSPAEGSLIEKSFRAMHTLKGSGSMFGFDSVSELTHELETIFDFVREGKINISKEILNISLRSVDQLKILLYNGEVLDEQEKREFEILLGDIRSIINEFSGLTSQSGTLQANKSDCDRKEEHSYYILFRPSERVLRDGTNPLYLIEDLCALGDFKVTPHCNEVPPIDAIDPLSCYLYWDIYLATNAGEQAIQDVFMFLGDDSAFEIHKVADTNLFRHEKFVEKINSLNPENSLNVEELTEFISSLLTIIKSKSFTSNKQEGAAIETGTSSIRVSSEKLDKLMNLISELITTQAGLTLIAEETAEPKLVSICENIQKISRQLRDNAFSICLIPIGSLTDRYNRLVRDLSQELNKKTSFLVEGGETELEKSVIESLNEPLLHILRNSIDHGIEPGETRLKLGKPAHGTIIFKAYYHGHHVFIQIIDDGAGIDTKKVREKAISKGLVSADAELGDKEILDLVFQPGFSTAEKVTGISGRGVGMDVVRRKIQELRGEISMTSTPGVGSSITIKLPLTLSIIDGLLVRVADTHFIIPLMVIDKCYEVKRSQLQQSHNQLIVLEGEKLPFIDLRENFELEGKQPDEGLVVMVGYNDQKIGIVVDGIIGEHQAVLKPLGKFYKNQDLLSGATILGDGTVALVIDTNRMINVFENVMTI